MTANPEPRANALINFMFDRLPVRGALLQLDEQWQQLHGQHDYSDSVRDLLGQTVAASAMIASTMKFDGMLTLQVHGKGALGMLIAQCTESLHVRGMAGELEPSASAASFADLVADGRLSLTVDAKDAKDRYQGIVELRPESMASSLAAYYEDSAQLPAHFVLLGDAQHVCALMLQRMPDDSGLQDDDWHRLCLMADTLPPEEFAAGMSYSLLAKLFAEDDVRVFDARDVAFRCRCTTARAERAVRMLGEQDANALLAERDNRIEIVCEFCNRKRTLDAGDVARLFNPAAVDGDSAVH